MAGGGGVTGKKNALGSWGCAQVLVGCSQPAAVGSLHSGQPCSSCVGFVRRQLNTPALLRGWMGLVTRAGACVDRSKRMCLGLAGPWSFGLHKLCWTQIGSAGRSWFWECCTELYVEPAQAQHALLVWFLHCMVWLNCFQTRASPWCNIAVVIQMEHHTKKVLVDVTFSTEVALLLRCT